jgi:predicted DNA-binding protein YlxM (UPF0122 family)
MKIDSVTMTLLYDYYGELLTEKQKTCFDLYYNQDYSLAEIAENEGISRQGVHDSIVRAETMLKSCEDKIGCVARARRIQEALAVIDGAAQVLAGSEDEKIQALAGEILRAADSIKE